MKIITDLKSLRNNSPSVVAIGKFDGLHRGHRRIFDAVLSEGREKGLRTVVFTFDKPIASLFTAETVQVLTTIKEKRRLFESLDIDCLVEFPLNSATAATEPEDFIKDILIRRLNAKVVVAGIDSTFGYKGRGDFEMLKSYGSKLRYEALEVQKVMYEGEPVSSTRIRALILNGDLEGAENLLGRPYSIEGKVEYGTQIGSKILSMPTVNLNVPDEKLLPPFGVYFSRVIIGEKSYRGITNIGTKPTVSDKGKVNSETYLYNFDGDLYGKDIRVELFHWHREEQRFPDVEHLKKQMHHDMLMGMEYAKGQ